MTPTEPSALIDAVHSRIAAGVIRLIGMAPKAGRMRDLSNDSYSARVFGLSDRVVSHLPDHSPRDTLPAAGSSQSPRSMRTELSVEPAVGVDLPVEAPRPDAPVGTSIPGAPPSAGPSVAVFDPTGAAHRRPPLLTASSPVSRLRSKRTSLIISHHFSLVINIYTLSTMYKRYHSRRNGHPRQGIGS